MSKLSKKFPKASRMPEVPRTVMISKCIVCGSFRRLADLYGDQCDSKIACDEAITQAKQKLRACDTCERFYPESELEGGTCRECQELPLETK